MSRLPSLTIVAGRPGAGKSTLAQKLAEEIRCPLISRDTIKEGMVNTSGDKTSPGGDVCAVFVAVTRLLLSNGVTMIAEAFFPGEVWADEISSLKKLATVRLIVCDVSLELANARVLRRPREDAHWNRLHGTPVDQTTRPPERYLPPELGVPFLRVDCSGIHLPDFPTILRFASSRQPLAGGDGIRHE